MDVELEKFFHKDFKILDNDFNQIIPSYEGCERYYTEFTEKMRKPDLYGKTVRVTSKQFPQIYEVIKSLCERMQLSIPNVFIFENYYYEFESYGIEAPWIEISAPATVDMDKAEFTFFLARELFKIKSGITKQYMIAEEFVKFAEQHSNILMFSNEMLHAFQLKYARWSRAAQYSADNFGLYVVGDIELATKCVLTSILNNKFLVENMSIKEYLNDCNVIDSYNDAVSIYTKGDEKIPYGQYRIKNMIQYMTMMSGG